MYEDVSGAAGDSRVSGFGHWVDGGTLCGEELVSGGK